jgi:arylsulfatase A-like enzyme
VEKTNGICDGYSFKPALEGERYAPRESLFFELGFARAVVKGKYKYLAVRYPEYAMNANLEERTAMLDGYNEMRRSFGGKAVNFDPSLPYGHLEMFPGGGDAEKATYGNKSGFFDPDQLYDLEADPEEEKNLAEDPEFEQVLEVMKVEMQKYLVELPGKFML